VQQLLDHLSKESPKLVEDLIPKMIPISTLQKILQNLLIEGVHIRDMRTIIETIAEHAAQVQDPNELTTLVRIALGRAIVQQIYGSTNELSVMTLDNRLERLLTQALQASGPEGAGIEPGLADTLAEQTAQAARRQEQMGLTPVLLVPGQLRTLLARFLRRALPNLKVLSHSELPDSKTIKVTSLVGGQA
jgi:flagellar biosynthesis protein FlhA